MFSEELDNTICPCIETPKLFKILVFLINRKKDASFLKKAEKSFFLRNFRRISEFAWNSSKEDLLVDTDKSSTPNFLPTFDFKFKSSFLTTLKVELFCLNLGF